jgi:hypothetical protein
MRGRGDGEEEEDYRKCSFFNPYLPAHVSRASLPMRGINTKTVLFPLKELLASGIY